jgi:GxxExxY protein
MNLALGCRRDWHQERDEELRRHGWHQERRVHPDESEDPDRADWICGGRGEGMGRSWSWMAASVMARGELIYERLTHSVIGTFFDVYNTLGFGFLEAVYSAALERELRDRGHEVGREVYVPVFYRGEEIARQRLDIVVDRKLVVEIKSTYELHGAAPRQVYNYLRGTRLRLGLILHFGPTPKFYRIFCDRPSTSSQRLIYPHNPGLPTHPGETSVLGASHTDAVDRPAIVGVNADSNHLDDVHDADSTGSP